jgi:predicted O-methyltransferase YrrM
MEPSYSFSFLEKPGHVMEAFKPACLELARAHCGDKPFEPPFSCLNPTEQLTLCNKAASTPEGAFVEVGVYWGGSAYHLINVAKRQGREIWLYDTFAGMPYCDSMDDLPVGEIKSDEAIVRDLLGPYPKIVKCVFPHTTELPEKIAFAHIDCDQYRAIKESCAVIEPLMVPGGIIWFDDVPLNGGIEGARQAVRELYGTRITQDEGSDRWYVRC